MENGSSPFGRISIDRGSLCVKRKRKEGEGGGRELEVANEQDSQARSSRARTQIGSKERKDSSRSYRSASEWSF